jgi:cell division protein FtsB
MTVAKKLFRIITNKFLLTGIAFLVWMLYFDQNDWSSQQRRKQELQDTEDNIAYLNSEIARMEKDHADMKSNPQKIEQYAREHYKMKRENEDLYIVEK